MHVEGAGRVRGRWRHAVNRPGMSEGHIGVLRHDVSGCGGGQQGAERVGDTAHCYGASERRWGCSVWPWCIGTGWGT